MIGKIVKGGLQNESSVNRASEEQKNLKREKRMQEGRSVNMHDPGE